MNEAGSLTRAGLRVMESAVGTEHPALESVLRVRAKWLGVAGHEAEAERLAVRRRAILAAWL